MATFDLHVERSGGPGPTVVFVHGGAVDLRLFDDVVSLLGARRSCVRYDRRGLGRSRSAAAGGSHLGDLVALLEGLGPATVVGSSVGGAIALAAAVERASLVTGLVLLAPLLIGAASGSDERLARLRRAAQIGPDAVADAYLDDVHLMGTAPLTPASRALVRQVVASNHHAWLGPPAAAPPPSVLGQLGDIQVPTVVLVGSEDDPTTIAGAEAVASGVRRGELRLIERAGHLVEIVRADEVARAILSD